jgi:drug/metabolite transporter (DMT)-like permease
VGDRSDGDPTGERLRVTASTRAELQVHFCVMLWSFTGILGKLISLSAFSLVWWRLVLVCGALLLWRPTWRKVSALPRRLQATYAGIGCLVALHWLTFYGSIKLANASVAATCLALTPVFLALVEPRIGQRKFDRREVALGLAVVPGVALVVGGVPLHMRWGLAVGVLSALLVAVFAACNKRFVHRADAITVTSLELGAGLLMMTLLEPIVALASAQPIGSAFSPPQARDAVLLLALAFGCTLVPFALSLVALRGVSAFTGQLIGMLEPGYTIVLAVLFFGEQRELGGSFYAGIAIVLFVVVAQPIWTRRARQPLSSQ